MNAIDLRDLARIHTVTAINRLVALMDSDNPGVACRACEAVLDRGWGRPAQAMEITTTGKVGGAYVFVGAPPAAQPIEINGLPAPAPPTTDTT